MAMTAPRRKLLLLLLVPEKRMMWQSFGKVEEDYHGSQPATTICRFLLLQHATLPFGRKTTCCSLKVATRRHDFPFYFFNTVLAIPRCLI